MENEVYQYFLINKGNVTLNQIAEHFNIKTSIVRKIITSRLEDEMNKNIPTKEYSTLDSNNPEYGLDFNIEREIDFFNVEAWLNEINNKKTI